MEQDFTTLADHVAVVRRRWRTLAAFVLLGAVLGVALAFLQTPQYTASTTLLLQTSTMANGDPQSIDPEEVATQTDVVLSDPVASRVKQTLGLPKSTSIESLLETVTAEAVEDKRIILVTAVRPEAREASRVANAFAKGYSDLRRDRAVEAQAAVTDNYISDLSDIQVQLGSLRGQLATASRAKTTEIRAAIASLLGRQGELQASLLLAQEPSSLAVGGGEILEAARVPTGPSEPRTVRAVLLGAVLGLVLGTLLAYLRDRSDDKVRGEQRVKDMLDGAPILGRIPTEHSRVRGRVAAMVDPHSPTSEAYRGLNTNLRFLLAAHSPGGNRPGGGMILVSSAGPGEGKTSVATNLAVTASRLGIRVVLVDADLRSPDVSRRFGLDVPRGLSDVLLANLSVKPFLQQVGPNDMLVLAAGAVPPNPAELLASARANSAWTELRSIADLVIVDSAPIVPVADSLELVREADELILVTRQGQSRLRYLADAMQRVQQVGGRVSGAVINDTADSHLSYGYGTVTEDQRYVPERAPV